MGAWARGRGEGSLASLARPPDLVEEAGTIVGLGHEQGILVTEGEPEASPAFELLETRTDHRLSSRWSLDAVTTPTRYGSPRT